ncbi:MAG: hypothetical protein KKA70_10800 [Proteobacteria bacterium]|nr:hypothetical protein [Pseudomonadota bacterium]MBU1714427.1 hypothetical protein [Pseudomonadota bacterium]
MGKNIFIVGLSWVALRFLWKVDLKVYYETFLQFIDSQDMLIASSGTSVAFLMVMSTYILRGINAFSLIKFFNTLLFELSQLAICIISMTAVAFWFEYQINIWIDLGITSIVPVEIVIASLYGLWLHDFNFPMGNKILNNISLPFISVIIIAVMNIFI